MSLMTVTADSGLPGLKEAYSPTGNNTLATNISPGRHPQWTQSKGNSFTSPLCQFWQQKSTISVLWYTVHSLNISFIFLVCLQNQVINIKINSQNIRKQLHAKLYKIRNESHITCNCINSDLGVSYEAGTQCLSEIEYCCIYFLFVSSLLSSYSTFKESCIKFRLVFKKFYA